MERNYLLVYESNFSGEVFYKYFETLKDMNDFIKKTLLKKYWNVLHKYEVKEI